MVSSFTMKLSRAMKIVKRFQLLKCKCTDVPCCHLSAPSIAMLSCKTKWIKSFLSKEFNFAVFVYEVCRNLFTNKIDFIKYAIKYGVEANQQDPRNKKTALHYSLMLCEVNVSKYLLQFVDPNILDCNGLPPMYYNVNFSMSNLYSQMNDDVKLRCFMKRTSEKLFKFIFFDEIPSHFNSWDKLSLKDLEMMPKPKRDYLLNNIRDQKGNTMLHIAAKQQYSNDIIKYLLSEYKHLVDVKNHKGKTASQKCKFVETISLFDTQWHKNIYWSYRVPTMATATPFAIVTFLFPELIEICQDDKLSIVEMNGLGNVINFLPSLHPTHIRKIAYRVRDSMGNNLWHIAAKYASNQFVLQFLFDIFPKHMIDYKNNQGDTPLHLAKSNPSQVDLLIKYGAHKDCLNLQNVYVKSEMNLQCMAARCVPVQHYPDVGPFKDIVMLHQARYYEYVKLENKKKI